MTCSSCGREVKATELDFCRRCGVGICQRCGIFKKVQMELGGCPVCDRNSRRHRGGEAMIKLYQPANGTEGMYFMAQFCDRCYHESGDGESPEGSCPIIAATMAYRPGDDNYPNQWRYDENGHPTCISFIERREAQP